MKIVNYNEFDKNNSKNSDLKDGTEFDFKKESSDLLSQSIRKNITLNQIPLKSPLKRFSNFLNLKKLISSDSKKSMTRVPNDICNLNEGLTSVEKELFKNTLYKTKTPKLLHGSSKHSKCNLHVKSNFLPKYNKMNDSFRRFKFLFEDLDHKSKSQHNSSMKSAFYISKTQNYNSEECDLSNLNRYGNDGCKAKTLNTSNINLSKNEDLEKARSIKREYKEKANTNIVLN